MIMVSVCLPSDALLQHLPSYLGFSYLGCGVSIQGKPFNITVIEVYAPTSNTEEAEVERFYEDLQDL